MSRSERSSAPAETFVIAREAANHADVVNVSVSHEGATGFGEGPLSTLRRVAESAKAFVEEHAECSATTRSL